MNSRDMVFLLGVSLSVKLRLSPIRKRVKPEWDQEEWGTLCHSVQVKGIFSVPSNSAC